MTGDYSDIMDLPRHEPETRRRMPRRDRAAQFAPFAALSGYEEKIREQARLSEGAGGEADAPRPPQRPAGENQK